MFLHFLISSNLEGEGTLLSHPTQGMYIQKTLTIRVNSIRYPAKKFILIFLKCKQDKAGMGYCLISVTTKSSPLYAARSCSW